MESSTNILVFKTNIKKKLDQQRIKKILDAIPMILRWNIDTKDADCVLRVVSHRVSPSDIMKVVRDTGYQCQELE